MITLKRFIFDFLKYLYIIVYQLIETIFVNKFTMADNLSSKNTQKIGLQLCFSDTDFELSVLYDFTEDVNRSLRLHASRVHLLFAINGPASFGFSPHYRRELKHNHGFVIYQPEGELTPNITAEPGTHLIHLNIRLVKMHELFSPDVHSAPIFQPEHANHKFYEEIELPSEVLMVLNQIEQKSQSNQQNHLFFQAKTLEILSLLFAEKQSNTEHCPFLKNEIALGKIKIAKNILLDHYKQPPTIPELARQVQLNEFQLKAGFKEIYGKGPYQYLLTYKMEIARKMLTEQKLQVQQVAHEVGYSNISHFIEAFKKQFGITPKKLLMNP